MRKNEPRDSAGAAHLVGSQEASAKEALKKIAAEGAGLGGSSLAARWKAKPEVGAAVLARFKQVIAPTRNW